MSDSRIDAVLRYHERTKHHYGRYARSLGYLDWDTQPDPFRRYAGAPLYLLPFEKSDSTSAYERIYGDKIAPQRVTINTHSRFFEMSLAISAWKEIPGSRWALRCNPSSGNLHPTEAYVICGPTAGITSGVFHYAAQEHGLERRAELSADVWRAFAAGFPADTFFVCLTSIFWREAWKYGERAFRYCQHDLGHAMAALSIAARGVGWRAIHLAALSDAQIARIVGIDREADFAGAEREAPEAMLAIVPRAERVPATIDDAAIERVAAAEWKGAANRLSADRVEWEVIDEVAEASMKPAGGEVADGDPASGDVGRESGLSVFQIARQRRSAVALDGSTRISRAAFYQMLIRTLPLRSGMGSALGWTPFVHLAIFVNLVDDLEPGLYFLVRNDVHEPELREGLRPQFRWTKPDGCPGELPLYLLDVGDCRRLAAQVSCGQDIAGMGAFSLGMIARFRPALDAEGAWVYRRLFWESGFIGQILYLEAEAAGVRGTGIGCYFDDPMHQVLGIRGEAWQSMYHFTVGGPIDDERLTTLPPYDAERMKTSGWQ